MTESPCHPTATCLPAPSFSSSLIKAVIQVLMEFAHAIKIYIAFNVRKDIKCKYVDQICGALTKRTIIVRKGPCLSTMDKTMLTRRACDIGEPPGGTLSFNLIICLGSRSLYCSHLISSIGKCLFVTVAKGWIVPSSFHFLSSLPPRLMLFFCILGTCS